MDRSTTTTWIAASSQMKFPRFRATAFWWGGLHPGIRIGKISFFLFFGSHSWLRGLESLRSSFNTSGCGHLEFCYWKPWMGMMPPMWSLCGHFQWLLRYFCWDSLTSMIFHCCSLHFLLNISSGPKKKWPDLKFNNSRSLCITIMQFLPEQRYFI